jgi:hypothetical protein
VARSVSLAPPSRGGPHRLLDSLIGAAEGGAAATATGGAGCRRGFRVWSAAMDGVARPPRRQAGMRCGQVVGEPGALLACLLAFALCTLHNAMQKKTWKNGGADRRWTGWDGIG